MFRMSTAPQHKTLSAQRWSLTGLSTHRQSILVLSAQQRYWDLSAAQRQVPCHSSDKVHYISYSSNSFMTTPSQLFALVDPGDVVSILSFWNIFSALDPLGTSLWGPKLSCPTESVATNKYWFSPPILGGRVMHSVMSSSAVDRVVEVVASTKFCPSTGGLNMQLNKVVWYHWLVDPRWIAPKCWTTSQWLKVTCSCTASLSSTTLPTKGQRSALLGGLNFSAQYCRLLA